MKKLFPVLLLSLLLMGGAYNKKLIFYVGIDDLDSVYAISSVNNTNLDTVIITAFPKDTFITVPDTSPVEISYLYYYALDTGLARSTSQGLSGAPAGIAGNPHSIWTTVTVDSSGTDVAIGTPSVDVKNTSLTTLQQKSGNGSGVTVFNVSNGTYVLSAIAAGFSFDTNHVAVTGNQTDTIWGYDIPVPSAAVGVNYVLAYIDIAKPMIDSITGLPIPLTKIELYLNLAGNPNSISGDWVIIPEEYSEKPDATGRVKFLIPATTVMTPEGCYYTLTYRNQARRSITSGTLGSFIVDTLPDPLKIVDAIQVWGQ